jgi:hypothetical protein
MTPSYDARPQHFQQSSVLSPIQADTYPGGSSQLRFCCSHKRMIAGRLPRRSQPHTTIRLGSSAQWLLPERQTAKPAP